MKPLRAVIVDDEPLARRRIARLLRDREGFEVVGEYGDGRKAALAIPELEPDLLFLDVRMPQMGGFEVLESLSYTRPPAVIFVTAYDEHAVRAFEVHALDYLMKPFDDDRFDQALVRARAQLRLESDEALRRRLSGVLDRLRSPATGGPSETAPPDSLERLVIRSEDRTYFLPVDDIDWIEAADYNIRIHTADRSYTTRASLGGVTEKLDPRRFVRIHRSTVVNIDRVRELQPWFHGAYVVVLQDGTELRLSRSRGRALQRILGQSI